MLKNTVVKHFIHVNLIVMTKLCTTILLSILLFSCKKNVSELSDSEDFLKRAKNYFESEVLPNLSVEKPSQSNHANPFQSKKSVLWNNASIIDFYGVKAVLAPVHYEDPFTLAINLNRNELFDVNDITRLLIYPDEHGSFHAEQIVIAPDTNYKEGKQFTGQCFYHDWYGRPLRGTQYKLSGPPQDFTVDQVASARATLICLQYYGYNYSSTGEAYYWSYSGGCYYIPDEPTNKWNGPGGGSSYTPGGGPNISPIRTFRILNGDNVISNIGDYLKCFDNIPGNDHQYQVILCVAQPKPGWREPWGVVGSGSSSSNPVFVGHTFLVLTEKTPNKTVTRNIGFYPQESVWPYGPAAPGRYNNDANQSYNISLTINMNNSEFTSLINSISQDAGTYNLNDRNCTTFALNALNAAGYVLPRTKGTWQGGSGLNPGDLGEDIRGLSLSPNMTRSTVYDNHPNTGDCF